MKKIIITESQFKTLVENVFNESKMKSNQERLRSYIKILEDDNSEEIYDFYIKFFMIVHNFLHLESKFSDLVRKTKKELNKYLDLPELSKLEDIVDKFTELYDTHHPVRFAVETFDSIEEIRVILRNEPKFYNELIYKY